MKEKYNKKEELFKILTKNFNSLNTFENIDNIVKNVKEDSIEGLLPESRNQLSKRDKYYSMFLKEFLSQYKKDKEFKNLTKKKYIRWVFIFFCILFACGLVLLISFLYCFFTNKADIILLISLLISSLVSITSSSIIVPIIIAKHLFPREIDTRMVELVKSLSSTDLAKYKIVDKDE